MTRQFSLLVLDYMTDAKSKILVIPIDAFCFQGRGAEGRGAPKDRRTFSMRAPRPSTAIRSNGGTMVSDRVLISGN